MKLIKAFLKYAYTLPQIILHRMRGVDTPYDQMVTFFRYFPFGKINLDQTVDIAYKKKQVKFFFGNLGPMIAGEFVQHDYDWLPVEGYDVIDIGAAYGDTAIIFCMRGAKRVVGYELNKRHYEMAKKNITINHLEDKVELNYCGVSSRKITNSDEILGAIIHGEDRSFIGEADFKTFDELVSLENNSDGIVLKIDVDGYEYEILRSANNKSINQFKFIAMEYHFGVQDLASILENSGFEVTVKPVTNISIDYHPVAFQKMEIGMIYAKRIRTLN